MEYLYDAVGKSSAFLNNPGDSNSEFDYGDWGDMWFITGCKPCMLKYDGTVDYYLDPSDYTKKEDGTASDISNKDYAGNAMASIPLVWVCRYEDDDYYYEIISDRQYNNSYHAYAHTQADGSIADCFYVGMFPSIKVGSRARSLYGSNDFVRLDSRTPVAIRKLATSNGSNYDVMSWSQKELIRTLLILMSGTLDFYQAFGETSICPQYSYSYYGLYYSGGVHPTSAFYGRSGCLWLFWILHFCGAENNLLVGLLEKGHKYYVKTTPINGGYSLYSTNGYDCMEAGHQDYDEILPANEHRKYIKEMTCSKYGMLFKSGSTAVDSNLGEWDTNGRYELYPKDFCAYWDVVGNSVESLSDSDGNEIDGTGYDDSNIYCAAFGGNYYNMPRSREVLSPFTMSLKLTAADSSYYEQENAYSANGYNLSCIICCLPPIEQNE